MQEKSRKKIIILTSEFPPEPGGIGIHALNLAKELMDQNIAVEVWAPYRKSIVEERIFDADLPFDVKRYTKGKYNFTAYFRLILKLKFTLKKNPSIQIITSGMIPLIIGGILKKILNSKRKMTVVVHGSDINSKHPILKRLVQWALKGYGAIIPVSNFTAAHLPQYLNNKIYVINNGVDTTKMERLYNNLSYIIHSKSKANPTLITVGTVSERKGQINIVKALPQILAHFPQVHYHIVGLSNKATELQKVAETLHVKPYISIHGAVPDEELVRQLSKADIFLMLSNQTSKGGFEGYGIAILEANLLGIPAIGSKNCGIEDAIIDGKTGLLVDAKNPKQITKAIEEILSNRSYFSRNAQKHAQTQSWKNVIKQYLKILNN